MDRNEALAGKLKRSLASLIIARDKERFVVKFEQMQRDAVNNLLKSGVLDSLRVRHL